MAWQPTTLFTDLRLVRSKDVAEWYGEVVRAWDSLQPPRADGTTTHWRNLGYWTDETRSLDEACRALTNRLADAAEVRPGNDVLDVGCGLGESTYLLHERLFGDGAGNGDGDARSRLVGLDLTAEHIERALARRRAQQPEFVVGSALDLPFPPGSFDRVLALECAFHFPDRPGFFAEAYRTLRPGGLLGMADVLVSPWFAGMLRGSDRVLTERARRGVHGLAADILKMPTENLIDLSEYRRQLSAAGFMVQSVEDISAHVFPYFMRYWRRAQDRRRQENLLRETGVSQAVASERARAWRRQMRVLMLGWHSSRFVIVTAKRPDGPGATGR